MADPWEARYVDREVDRAWFDLRVRLADRFEAALAEGGMDGVGISGPAGQSLTVHVEDGTVVVLTDELQTAATANVDEAAHVIYRVLHDEWQVVHPAFLDSDLVEVAGAGAPDGELGEGDDPGPGRSEAGAADVPEVGRAESREELHAWVIATFADALGRGIRIAPDESIGWRTSGGNRVVVVVQNAGRVQFHAVLAREVGFKRAHRLIDRLSRKWFGLKFFLEKDSLVMAQVLIADPFVPAQLMPALRAFIHDVDRFAWVQEAVESRRARDRRAEIAELRRAKEKAESQRDRALRRLRRLRREQRRADDGPDPDGHA